MPQPSLRNLQVFEAAARFQNFRQAAEALYLTPGAVSRQVRALEAELGVALFERVGRQVLLTEGGHRLYEAVAQGMQIMFDAAAALHRDAAGGRAHVVVTVLPSFASRWLVPRLQGFYDRHPNISVELVATIAPIDLSESSIDLGIRYGRGPWPGVTARRLAREYLFPVAAAAGIKGHRRLPQSAADILRYPRLNPYEHWGAWQRRAGILTAPAQAGPSYDDTGLMLQAAEAGQGVAIGRSWLVQDAINEGRLLRLPGPRMVAPRAYFLVQPQGRAMSPAAQAFATWITEIMAVEPTE